mgnify:FL=1
MVWFTLVIVFYDIIQLHIFFRFSVYIIELFYHDTPVKPIKQSLLDVRIVGVYVALFVLTAFSEVFKHVLILV